MRFEEAYRLLVKPGDGPVSRHLNRHISIRISLLLVRHGAPITPTQMSAISFATALAGALAFFLGYPLAGGLLAQLSSILDGCDGELARLTGQTSKRGGLVDSLIDRLADVALVLGLAYLAYRSPWPPWLWPTWLPWPGDWPLLALALTALALTGSLMVSYTSERYRAATQRDLYEDIPLLLRIGGKRDERISTGRHAKGGTGHNTTHQR